MLRPGHVVPAGLTATLACLLSASAAGAATLEWKGHTWQLTSGGMAGVCAGDPANVSVDADDYLHLAIKNSGGPWKAAELFTTDKLGFGTYQWQIDGPIDTYDKNVVLGLFPYGPAAGIGDDGTNEIDIEYSRWGVANGPNGDFANYPASGTTVGELSYTFSLGGSTLSTSRFVWTATSITSSLLGGLVAVTESDPLLTTFAYAPSNPTQNIPQQALPLGMNLWCFDAPPSDAQPVEIVIRDFTFVPAGAGGGGMPSSGGMDSGGKGNGAGSGGSAAGRGGSGTGGQATSAGAGGRRGGGAAAGTAGAAAETGGAGGTQPGAAGTTPNDNGGGSAGASRGGSAGSGAGASAGGSPASSAAGGAGKATTPETAGASSGGAPGAAADNTHGCGCSVPRANGSLAHGLVALAVTTFALRRRKPPRAR